MHANINNGVGTLTNLLADYIVIKGGFCREYNNFFLLQNLLLLVTRSLRWDLLWDTCGRVARGSFVWSSQHISHHFNSWLDGVSWRRLNVSARLTLLNKSCLYVSVSVSSSLIKSPTSWSRCSEGIASRGLLLWTRLEEKVIDDHLSLIHVNWRYWLRARITLSSRSLSFLEHISLLLLEELHVLLWRLVRHFTESIYNRLSLVKLLLSLALISHIHGGGSRPRLIRLIR